MRPGDLDCPSFQQGCCEEGCCREEGWGEWPTEVLDQELLLGEDTGFLANEGPSVLERLVGRGIEETDAVEVVAAGFVGNQDLDLLDRGIVGHLDGRRKLLDGLLGSVCEREGNWGRHGEDSAHCTNSG